MSHTHAETLPPDWARYAVEQLEVHRRLRDWCCSQIDSGPEGVDTRDLPYDIDRMELIRQYRLSLAGANAVIARYFPEAPA